MINETKQKMHPANIKAALEIAGTNQSKIAEELGVSGSAVNLVINGKSVSRTIAECIAQKIGKSLDDIWPGRYTTDQAA